jgi:hypothetical protein
VDETGSVLCPVAGVGISDAEPSGLAIAVFVSISKSGGMRDSKREHLHVKREMGKHSQHFILEQSTQHDCTDLSGQVR